MLASGRPQLHLQRPSPLTDNRQLEADLAPAGRHVLKPSRDGLQPASLHVRLCIDLEVEPERPLLHELRRLTCMPRALSSPSQSPSSSESAKKLCVIACVQLVQFVESNWANQMRNPGCFRATSPARLGVWPLLLQCPSFVSSNLACCSALSGALHGEPGEWAMSSR